MRLSLVTETYFPQVNGVSRTLGQLVAHLTATGNTVQLLLPNYGTPPVHEPSVVVPSLTLPFYKELHLPVPPCWGALKAMDAFRPDLVHVATEATLGFPALRHARKRGYPVVSSFHTNFDQYSDHYGLGLAKGTIWRYLRWFHNQTRETYVPSRAAIANLADRGFERLVLWPRGVDSGLFRPDRPGRARVREALGFGPDDVVITYVSRLAVEKNIGYLTEALAEVVSQRPKVRLLFVGDGPAREEVESVLGDHASFVGYRTGEDLADHYSAGDLFAFSSLTETFGNVILEAMASGLPVVALRAGGPGDIVLDGETGELVPPEAPPSEFAKALLRLVDDPSLRLRASEAAREFAERQSWAEIMEVLRGRYEAVIAESNAPDALTTSRR